MKIIIQEKENWQNAGVSTNFERSVGEVSTSSLTSLDKLSAILISVRSDESNIAKLVPVAEVEFDIRDLRAVGKVMASVRYSMAESVTGKKCRIYEEIEKGI
jgi:hypothetical protein